MKKIYESPAFFAEAYSFSDSIAKCAHSVDPNEGLPISKGQNVCGGGLDGHVYGGQNGGKGNIVKDDGGPATVVLFNDGIAVVGANGCQYDWDYNNNVVYNPSGEPRGNFAEAFYGNDANAGSHSAGYIGAAFLS